MTEPGMIALQDQLEAASRHAEEVARYIASFPGYTSHEKDNDGPGPLGLRIKEWKQTLVDKRVRVCTHSTTIARILWGHLAVPGDIYCDQCHLLAAIIYDSQHPTTCDACGKEVESNIFVEVMVRSGNLILHGNVCVDCDKESDK